MNERAQGWWPSVTLLVLALASGIGWRVELELRSGWASLAWLRYVHWAVPISVCAFIAWVVWVTRVRRSLLFATFLLAFAVVAYHAVDFVFSLYFAEGMYGLRTVLFLGGGDFDVGSGRLWMLPGLVLLFWVLLPLAFCGICRGFGVPITIRAAVLSAALFVASWPVSIFVRSFVDDRGSGDLIHALKSGFVIPFLVVSLGWPLLRRPRVLGHAVPQADAG